MQHLPVELQTPTAERGPQNEPGKGPRSHRTGGALRRSADPACDAARSWSDMRWTRASKVLVGFQPRGLGGLGGIAEQVIDFGKTELLWVSDPVVAVVGPDPGEGHFAQVAYEVHLVAGDDEVENSAGRVQLKQAAYAMSRR